MSQLFTATTTGISPETAKTIRMKSARWASGPSCRGGRRHIPRKSRRPGPRTSDHVPSMRPPRRSTRSGRGPSRLVGAPGGGFPSSTPSLRRIPGIGRHRDQTQSDAPNFVSRPQRRRPRQPLPWPSGPPRALHSGGLVEAAALVRASDFFAYNSWDGPEVLRLRDFFARVEERLLDDRRGPGAVRLIDREFRADVGVYDGQHRVPNVRLQPRGVDCGRDPADRPSPGGHGPFRHVEFDGLAVDLNPDQFPLRAFVLDALEGGFADEVARLVEVDGPPESDFVRVVLDCHVRAVVQDARLDAADIRGTRGPEVVLLPRLDDRVPEMPALRTVEQIQLVSDLAGPTGASDEERDPVELRPEKEVIRQGRNLLAEQVGHQGFRLRTLDLERRGVRLPDRHLHAGVTRDALRPEEDVAVREGDPEPVLLEAEEDGIVQDAAVLVRDEDVLPLADLALRHVPRGEELHERESVGSADLDVAFDRHVPQGDVFEQMPIFLHGIVVIAREEGVVVHSVGLAACLPRLVEERGPTETRTALNERHVVAFLLRSRRFPRRLFPSPLLSRHSRPNPRFIGGGAPQSWMPA